METDEQTSAVKYLHSVVKWCGFKQPGFQFSIHSVEVFRGIVTHSFSPIQHHGIEYLELKAVRNDEEYVYQFWF